MTEGTHQWLRGVAVSEGMVVGPAFIIHPLSAEVPSYSILMDEVNGEVGRFEAALRRAEREIRDLLEGMRGPSDAVAREVLETHVLVVSDHSVVSEVERRIRRDLRNVEEVYFRVVEEYAERLAGMDDDLFRERALDFRDVGHRVIRALKGGESSLARFPEWPCVLIAKELKPSEVVGLDRRKVMGVITEAGGKTSHAAIIARSLGIPMVAGVHGVCAVARVGQDIFLDGATGEVCLEVGEELRRRLAMGRERSLREQALLESIRAERAVSKDGFHIALAANMESVAEVAAVRNSGAEGIGLFRTEFLYLEKNDLPSEEEQASVYRAVADAAHPWPVVLRTLDLGGDKVLESNTFSQEANPFLGLRAIRLCLSNEGMFRQQLRAMVQVARERLVRIMYPMVSTVDEVRAANALLDSVCREMGFDGTIEVGAMIEVPSAAICARSIAREVDFLSVGTNDLVQYVMAADRLNESVSYLYQPVHPAVVKLIEMTASAAAEEGIPVGVCGESAGDLLLTPLFLSLGVTSLSVGAALVPRIKAAVRSLNRQECLSMRGAFLSCESQQAVLQLTEGVARKAYGDLLTRG